MKLFKKIFTATVIFLILASVAGIIYVLQFQEEPSAVKEPAKETKRMKPEKTGPVTKGKPGAAKSATAREVAIIVDDIGYSLGPVKELLKINAALTFAILPFQTHTRETAEILHKSKREILLHLPMEPVSYPREKPGEGSLFTDMNDDELIMQLRKDIADVPYVSGVNNHMGSKFMTDENRLVLIFKELKKKNLFFVDSRTSNDSKASAAAKKTGLRFAERKIFIDNNHDYNKIYNILIDIAKDNDVSSQIIIGHPHPETIRAVKDAVKVFREKGISIVPVSKLVSK